MKHYADPFLAAIARGDLQTVQSQLATGVLLHRYCHPYSYSLPLCVAIENDQREIAQYLITQGADVNQTLWEQTPLTSAVKQDDFTMVQLLLNAGAHPTGKALCTAVEMENITIIQALLESKADVNLPTSAFFSTFTPLYYAVKSQNTDIAKMLLDRGAYVNLPDSKLLVTAAQNADAAMAKLLLEYGIFTNTYKNDAFLGDLLSAEDTSALFNAIFSPDKETFNLLLNAGVDSELPLTPIDIAIIQGDTQALHYWAQYYDINSPDPLGIKPIHYAAITANSETIDILHRLGADINAPLEIKDAEKHWETLSPMQMAVILGDEHIVEAFIRNGACVHQMNEGDTLLHSAIFNEHASGKIAQLLIEHGVEVDVVTNDGGWTPLQIAIFEGNIDIVSVLVANGADPYIRNHDDGKNAFEMLDHDSSLTDDAIALRDEISALLKTTSHHENTLHLSEVITDSHAIAGLDMQPSYQSAHNGEMNHSTPWIVSNILPKEEVHAEY